MEWESLRQHFGIGDTIQFATDSPIYPGPYSSSIVSLCEEQLRINMPLDEGKLVLIPVGTRIRIFLDSERHVEAVVVDRIGGGERLLVVQRAPNVEDSVDAKGLSEGERQRSAPVLAVTSGKGGVGKTNLAVNLAIALQQLGKRACIIDADLGTANVDVLLRLSPPFNLGDVVSGKKHMIEVLVEGPKGILVLPGGSGLRSLTRLPDEAFTELMAQFQALEAFADVILLDTGSGVSPNVTNFVAASSAAVLVTTPEPHAVTDGYALIRMLAEEGHKVPIHLVVNRVQNRREGSETLERMIYAARRFLGYEVLPLGFLHEDRAVPSAVRQQVDLLTFAPKARVVQEVRDVAERLVETLFGEVGTPVQVSGGTGRFLWHVRTLFSRERDASAG